MARALRNLTHSPEPHPISARLGGAEAALQHIATYQFNVPLVCSVRSVPLGSIIGKNRVQLEKCSTSVPWQMQHLCNPCRNAIGRVTRMHAFCGHGIRSARVLCGHDTSPVWRRAQTQRHLPSTVHATWACTVYVVTKRHRAPRTCKARRPTRSGAHAALHLTSGATPA